MKKMKLWLILCVSILVLGVVGSFMVLAPKEGTVVEIVQDSKTLYEIDLSNEEPRTIEVAYSGRINIVQIDTTGISVVYAECPDQNCVHMGYLDENSLPIVCLPNHLVIQYRDSTADVDVVTR